MPERLQRLQATLDEFERELHSVESLDQHTRGQLEEAGAKSGRLWIAALRMSWSLIR